MTEFEAEEIRGMLQNADEHADQLGAAFDSVFLKLHRLKEVSLKHDIEKLASLVVQLRDGLSAMDEELTEATVTDEDLALTGQQWAADMHSNGMSLDEIEDMAPDVARDLARSCVIYETGHNSIRLDCMTDTVFDGINEFIREKRDA